MLRSLLLLLLFSISIFSQAESPSEIQSTSSISSIPSGLTVRLVPAFFNQTYGLEVEYPFNRNSTLGLNALYYVGSGTAQTDSSTAGDGTFADPGFLVELQYKYYFTGSAPIGLYAMLAAGYNSILYPDGATRPFTVLNTWENQNTITGNVTSIPTPYIGSIGLGYQVIMIEPHISGNIVMGVQLQTGTTGLLTNLFITPSLGWTF